MKKLYLKVKRTLRFIFYRNLNINEQLDISYHIVDDNLLNLYWNMSKADRQHSYEVFNRTKEKSEDSDLLLLSLLHDIGKSKIDAGVIFRILSDLGFISNNKSVSLFNVLFSINVSNKKPPETGNNVSDH